MSTKYEFVYNPAQKQCPKCGDSTLTVVGAMPAKPYMDVALTCSGCGAFTGVSPVGQSTAGPSEIADWGAL